MSELQKTSPGAEIIASNLARPVELAAEVPKADLEVSSTDPKDYLKQVIRGHMLRPGWVFVVYNSAPWERVSGSIKSIATKDGFQACLVGKRSSVTAARMDIALVHWLDKSTSRTGRISYIGPLELTGIREGTDASYEEKWENNGGAIDLPNSKDKTGRIMTPEEIKAIADKIATSQLDDDLTEAAVCSYERDKKAERVVLSEGLSIESPNRSELE